jgi:hypothetical protein
MPFATLFGELPAILALGAAEQSRQIPPAPSSGFAAPKSGSDTLVRII